MEEHDGGDRTLVAKFGRDNHLLGIVDLTISEEGSGADCKVKVEKKLTLQVRPDG